MKEKTKVIALRVPGSTYGILVERSKDWGMSISFLIRELVIKVFEEKTTNPMKHYRKRKDDDYGRNSSTKAGN